MYKLLLAASAFGAVIAPAVAHSGSVNIPNVSVPHVNPHVATPNTHVVPTVKNPNALVNQGHAGGGVWIDSGAPVMVAPDGRKYPLTTTRSMTRPPQ